MTQVKLKAPDIDLPTPAKIRLQFMSLAAPTAMPVSPKPVAQAPAREVRVKPKLVKKISKPVQTQLVAVKIEKTAFTKIKTRHVPPIENKQAADVRIPTPRMVTKKPILKKIKPVLTVADKAIEKKPEKEITPVQVAKVEPTERPNIRVTKSVSTDKGSSVSTVIQKAHYRERTPPVYPRRAYELGQQGLVTLHALVATNGLAKALKIESSSGHRMLDRAALAAVKKWEFEPPTQNGQKIQSWVSVPVKFVIR